MKRNRSKLEAGFSMVELTIGMGLIALSAVGVAAISQVLTVSVHKTESLREASYFHADALTRLRRVLVEVEENPGQQGSTRNKGLCSFMSPANSLQGGGVDRIFLDLSPSGGRSFGESLSTTRWDQFFSDQWTMDPSLDASCAGNSNVRCFRPSLNNEIGRRFKNGQLKLIASIKPVSLDATSSPGFMRDHNLVSGLRVDSNQVAFILQTEIRYRKSMDQEGVEQSSQQKNLIWGAEVAWCDYQLSNGRWVRLTPSGSGLADPVPDRTLLNKVERFDVSNPPLTVDFEKRLAQVGQVTNSGFQRAIGSDFSRNIAASCSESRFKCRNAGGPRQYQDLIDVWAQLFYSPGDNGNRAVQPTSFNLRFKNNTGQWVTPGGMNVRYTRLPNLEYRTDSDGRMYLYDSNQSGFVAPRSELVLQGGSSRLVVEATGVAGFCQAICPDGGGPEVRPVLDYTLWDIRPGLTPQERALQVAYEGERLGCTVCYMKACRRLGIDTFGPLNPTTALAIEQPQEPLDGVVPECALNEGNEVDQMDPFHSIPGAPGQCIKARVNGNSFEYQAANCGQTLPALCFGFGKHLVAKDISSGNYDGVGGDAVSASRRCYQMGRERMALSPDRIRLSLTTNISPSDSAGVAWAQGAAGSPGSLENILQGLRDPNAYDYVNNAKSGLFLAPQSAFQVSIATRYMNSNQQSVGEFWVGLMKDTAGETVAQIPFAGSQPGVARESAAYYFLPNGIPRLTTFADHPFGSGGALVLAHHIRWRGAIAASPSQGQALRFVCRSTSAPYRFFVTSNGATQASLGPTVCGQSGGLFLPPTTPLQWAAVLQMIAPNHSNYPFPDPSPLAGVPGGIYSTNNPAPQAAWVALEFTGTHWDLPGFVPRLASLFSGSPTRLVDLGSGSFMEEDMDDPSFVPTVYNMTPNRIPRPISGVICRNLNSRQFRLKSVSSPGVHSPPQCDSGEEIVTRAMLTGILNRSKFLLTVPASGVAYVP